MARPLIMRIPKKPAPREIKIGGGCRALIDPYKLFANYPTKILAPQTEIALGPVAENGSSWFAISNLRMVTFTKPLIASDEEINQLIDQLKIGPKTANSLLTHYTPERQAIVFRTIAFLIKLGILKVR